MIALTGPTGYIGRRIRDCADQRRVQLVSLARIHLANPPHVSSAGQTHSAPTRIIGELGPAPIDPAALAGCSAVIHSAARAHRMGERGPPALELYRHTNVAGTRSLILAMSQAGVRRLVYVSSIKAVGERSSGIPVHPNDLRHPEDPYGQSKAEAEDAVLAAQAQGLIDAVIIRPVLVHGPGAKGNLQRLMAAIYAGKRLPLGGVHNRRSFVGVDNLADALLVAATADFPGGEDTEQVRERTADVSNTSGDLGQDTAIAPRPTEVGRPCRLKSALRSRTYHIADDGVISTRRLVEVLAEGMGVQLRLVNVPRWLAVGGATLLGKGAMARRLFDDLEVDDSDFRRDFGWRPTIGLEDGLRMMAADYAKRMREGRSDV